MTAAGADRLLPVGHRLGPVFGDQPPSSSPRVVLVGGRHEVLAVDEDRVWRAARPDATDRLLGDPRTLHLRSVTGGSGAERIVPELERRGLLLRVPATGVEPGAVRGHRVRPVGVGLERPGPDGTDDFGAPQLPLLALSPDESWHWQLTLVAPDLRTAARLVAGDAAGEREPTAPELGAALDRVLDLAARALAAGCARLDVADQPW